MRELRRGGKEGEPVNGGRRRIATREQLFAFARATAAKRKPDGGLAIRLEDARPSKRRH